VMQEIETREIIKDLYTKAPFKGRLLMLGCGSIGQGVLPLLFRHTDITPERMHIVTADTRGKEKAQQWGIPFDVSPLTQENYPALLRKHTAPGDFLLNLSVDVASLDIIEFCQKRDVTYVDTSLERWPGFHTNTALPLPERTNYALRQDLVAMRKKYPAGTPTAVVSHGANPGLISHFLKAALLHVARDTGVEVQVPQIRSEWAALMHTLKVRTIQIAERDTQASTIVRRPDEFVNTWSIDGFLSEAAQPSELGWGSHEKEVPQDGHEYMFGNKTAIYLGRPGALTLVRSWTPREGPYHGFLITHDEAISMADYFTVHENEEVVFRPTVMYAYHPSDDAAVSLREYAGNDWREPRRKRMLMGDITYGGDELGVLLLGHKKRGYWFGSDLSIAQARELNECQNATGLQVTAGAFAAVVWALENPGCGIVEPEDLDFDRVLKLAEPYLGIVHGKYTSWTPLRDRKEPLFPEDVCIEDPWQFKNFRVR